MSDLINLAPAPSYYLTSLSSNTPETIAYEIRASFAEHPATGLHKAELYIYGTSQAIRLAIDSIAADKRKIDALHRDLDRLLKYQHYRLDGLYHLFTRKYLDLEILDLKAKVRAGQCAISDAVPMLEDAQSELAAAIEQRSQILENQPWLNTTKAEVSAACDRLRLEAKLARIAGESNRLLGAANPIASADRPLFQLQQEAAIEPGGFTNDVDSEALP